MVTRAPEPPATAAAGTASAPAAASAASHRAVIRARFAIRSPLSWPAIARPGYPGTIPGAGLPAAQDTFLGYRNLARRIASAGKQPAISAAVSAPATIRWGSCPQGYLGGAAAGVRRVCRSGVSARNPALRQAGRPRFLLR